MQNIFIHYNCTASEFSNKSGQKRGRKLNIRVFGWNVHGKYDSVSVCVVVMCCLVEF